MPELESIELFAWMGKDELGSGEIGIKQALCPAGMIPMVSINKDKMLQGYIKNQMNIQGKHYKKKIKLCRFKFEEVIIEVGDSD
jgi:hypothetical protein